MTPHRLTFPLLVVLLLPLACRAAGTLTDGMPMPGMSLHDQHERPATLDAAAAVILFAPDRDAGDVAHPLLQALGADRMAARRMHYVADISAMPAFVAGMFAVPAMRDYAYPVLLGREAGDTAGLPRHPGQVTVLHLEQGRIRSIDYAADTEALGLLLHGAPDRTQESRRP